MDFSDDVLTEAIGHELFHSAGFDNQSVSIHNRADQEIKIDGEMFTGTRVDRVYACQLLCFAGSDLPGGFGLHTRTSDLVSREECELCLDEKGHPDCAGLIRRSELSKIDSFHSKRFDFDEAISRCGSSSYNVVYKGFKDATSLDQIQNALSGKEFDPERNLKCITSGFGEFDSYIKQILERHPVDNKNRPKLEHLLRENAVFLKEEELLSACRGALAIEKAKELCLKQSHPCQEVIDRIVEKAGVSGWNTPAFLSEQIEARNMRVKRWLPALGSGATLQDLCNEKAEYL